MTLRTAINGVSVICLILGSQGVFCGCATLSASPQGVKKLGSIQRSATATSSRTEKSMMVIAPPKEVWLMWNGPTNRNFRIDHSLSPYGPWTLYGTTLSNVFKIQIYPTNAQEYFKAATIWNP